MRKILLIAFAIVGFATLAQEQDNAQLDSIPADLAKKIFVYNASKQYNDPIITRMAIYDLLAENPNNVSLRDSLAMTYLQQQMYASAALVSQEVVSAVPDDMYATEIAAISFERLGVKNKALNFYEKLYLNNTDDIDRLYKMAFLQMDLKLFEEALASVTQLTSHKLAPETTLIFPTDDGQGQEISMEHAAERLKGMIEEARGNKEEAVNIFKELLKSKSDFEVVKKQLAELDK